MAQRGRPRSEGIPRYNVATSLRQHEKFFKFRRVLRISDKEAFTLLHAFWEFVAVNYAMKCSISGADPDVIAEYCWFDGEPAALISALKVAGFLEEDGTVHDWRDHQPLVEFNLARRKDTETGSAGTEIPEKGNNDLHNSSGEGIMSDINGQSKAKQKQSKENLTQERSSPPTPPSSGGNVENPDERPERGSTNQPRSPTDLATDLANAKRVNGRQTESKSSTVVHLTDELCGILGVRETQDRTTIFVHVSRAVANVGDQPVWGVIGDVKLGVRERRFKNPIGVAISELKKLAPSGNGTGQVYAPG